MHDREISVGRESKSITSQDLDETEPRVHSVSQSHGGQGSQPPGLYPADPLSARGPHAGAGPQARGTPGGCPLRPLGALCPVRPAPGVPRCPHRPLSTSGGAYSSQQLKQIRGIKECMIRKRISDTRTDCLNKGWFLAALKWPR